MLAIKILSGYELKDLFKKYDRNEYSVEACEKIMEILESSLRNENEIFLLDIVALSCQFHELTIQDAFEDYCDFSPSENGEQHNTESDMIAALQCCSSINFYLLKNGNCLVEE